MKITFAKTSEEDVKTALEQKSDYNTQYVEDKKSQLTEEEEHRLGMLLDSVYSLKLKGLGELK